MKNFKIYSIAVLMLLGIGSISLAVIEGHSYQIETAYELEKGKKDKKDKKDEKQKDKEDSKKDCSKSCNKKDA